jgi:ribosome recycling factor
MQKAVEALRRELSTIRTGRASPSLVERLTVEYFGTPTPLNQLASISVPEPRMLAIQPWDKGSIPIIEKAIQKSDLGLTPTNDGRQIRLVIPQLTEERRRDLVKVVRRKVEEGKVAVRNTRRDVLEEAKKAEKDKKISEDELKRAQERLQKLTDRYVQEVERVGAAKEAETLGAMGVGPTATLTAAVKQP